MSDHDPAGGADDEFRPGAREPSGEPPDAPPRGTTRREMLKLAALGAVAGAAACFEPAEQELVPLVRRPPGTTPGRPLHHATAHALHGYAIGLVTTSWDGRPTKVDGNPRHPMSLGATSAIEQALPMELYDPERARFVTQDGQPSDLRAFLDEQTARARALEGTRGAGLRLLLEPTASPTLAALRRRVLARFPAAKAVPWHPLARDAVLEGARLAYGAPLEPLPDHARAAVVLSLDDDLLGRGPRRLRDARATAGAREPGPRMQRLWCVEPALSLTGMYADHRLAARGADVERFARALLLELADGHGVPGLAWARGLGPALAPWPEAARFVRAAAADLARHGAGALVVAGLRQPPLVHALAHAVNEALGSAAALVSLVPPALDAVESGPAGLKALSAELAAGAVDTLLVAAFDPVYTAPADVDLAAALRRAPRSAHLALHRDQTSPHVHWVLPRAASLEQWGDARAVDGTASIVQPLIAPIYPSHDEAALLRAWAGTPDAETAALVRQTWREARGAEAEADWSGWLAAGVVPGTAAAPVRPVLRTAELRAALAATAPVPAGGGLELDFLEDYRVHDGRFARNAWLQELPDPVTKQTWGNAALLGPATARRLGVTSGDGVRVSCRGRALELPAVVVPGQADGTVALALGYGQPGPGPLAGERVGESAYRLRFSDAPWFAPGAEVVPLGRRLRLAVTQASAAQEGRALALQADLSTLLAAGPGFLAEERRPREKLYRTFGYDEQAYAWGMAIDLNRCIGCSACVVACQAENNTPVVGPRGVEEGREMHWLRIDRYFGGTEAAPTAITQPVACVHCEAAPCEYVCPVNATVHSDEGLNEMVYNRCVGTRFCSNNCPYKVRRFNWTNYQADQGPVEQMVHNPDVSVRTRGVMEKCTYCVQRIERARIGARRERRPIDLAALETACQQACPTRAITFGSLHDEDSPVARWHRDRRHYLLLDELGTRPRTAHLARIKNPSDEP